MLRKQVILKSYGRRYDFLCAGQVYVRAAQTLQSDSEVQHEIMAANLKEQSWLATELETEQLIENGGTFSATRNVRDVVQNVGMACPSCRGFFDA